MIKAVLFDNGGVLQGPNSGNWLLGPHHREIYDLQLTDGQLSAIDGYLSEHPDRLPEAKKISTEQEEEALFVSFYKEVFEIAGIRVPDDAIARLSADMTYSDERLFVFDDVFDYLPRFHAAFETGMLSDATPSSRRIVHNFGIAAHLDHETYSFELGVTKPSEEMFRTAVEKFRTPASEMLFIDDSGTNLKAAAFLGLTCVQMQRGKGAVPTKPWDGPIVHNLSELWEFAGRAGS
ncbi:MAG: HAD-IA family hydrolase [Lachnospiraceae bacterium]|nr:HAD-IA family hydrolase [Lachnospiraceae bacterium]